MMPALAMPLLLRHALIRLLLLAVFFNTAIGLPAHQAEHLHQAMAASVISAQPTADEAFDAEHGSEAHGACAWCLAYAHLGTPIASSAVTHAVAWQAERPRPQARAAFVPDPCHWRFASRDPPQAVS
jgi:hypothetical protein